MANVYEYRALGIYKENLFKLLLNDTNELCEHLVDLLMPTLLDDRFDKWDNFVGGEKTIYEHGVETKVNLPQHCFDVPFIYSVITDGRNVICVDDDVSRCDQSIKELSIIIYVMCNKDMLELTTQERAKYRKLGYIGKNRVDVAVAIIGDIINHANVGGIGKLQPTRNNPTRSYFPGGNNDYWGKVLSYIATDFMIDYGDRSVNGL